MADYGYFGKGAEGYAHYSQTFKSTFPRSSSSGSPRSSSSGSRGSYNSTVHSSPSTRMDTAAEQKTEPNSTDQSSYTDPDLENATLNAFFAVGMFALAAVVFVAIVLSI